MDRQPTALAPLGRIALGVVVAGIVSSACSALSMTAAASPLDASVQIALADAARRSGLPIDSLRVQSAQAVTWRDGSLGCPQPGVTYTQALVVGYRIRIVEGGRVLDYHAGRNGVPQWCPPGRAQEPMSDDARR